METLHVVFVDNNHDPKTVLSTIKKFDGDKTILICCQSEVFPKSLKNLTAEVFEYQDDFIIHPNTIKMDSKQLSQKLSKLVLDYKTIQFNITSAGPYEAYLAYSVKQNYPGIYIGAIGEDNLLRDLNIAPLLSLDSLSEEEKLLLYILGENKSGLKYQELIEQEIITHKGKLKNRGLTRILKNMRGKYIEFEQEKGRTGSGKRPYIWKLNDEGERLYSSNIDALRVLDTEVRLAFNNSQKI